MSRQHIQQLNKDLSQEYGDALISHDIVLEDKTNCSRLLEKDTVSESPEIHTAIKKWGVILRPVNRRNVHDNSYPNVVPVDIHRLQQLSPGDLLLYQQEGAISRGKSKDIFNKDDDCDTNCITDVKKLSVTIENESKELSLHERRITFEKRLYTFHNLANDPVHSDSSLPKDFFYRPSNDSTTQLIPKHGCLPQEIKSAITLHELLKHDELKLTVDILEAHKIDEQKEVTHALDCDNVVNNVSHKVKNNTLAKTNVVSKTDQNFKRSFLNSTNLRLPLSNGKSILFYETFSPTRLTETVSKSHDINTNGLVARLNHSSTQLQENNARNFQVSMSQPNVGKQSTATCLDLNVNKLKNSESNERGENNVINTTRVNGQPKIHNGIDIILQPALNNNNKEHLDKFISYQSNKTSSLVEFSERRVISEYIETSTIKAENEYLSTKRSSCDDNGNGGQPETDVLSRNNFVTPTKHISNKIGSDLVSTIKPLISIPNKPVRYNKLGQVVIDELNPAPNNFKDEKFEPFASIHAARDGEINVLNARSRYSGSYKAIVNNHFFMAEEHTIQEKMISSDGSLLPSSNSQDTVATGTVALKQSGHNADVSSYKLSAKKSLTFLGKQKRRVGKLIIMTGEERNEQLNKKQEDITARRMQLAAGNQVSQVLSMVSGLALTFISNELGELEEDFNDQPVVPEVVFNEPVCNIKSIITKNNTRKKTNVTFNTTKLAVIYTYPSEASYYKEYENKNDSVTSFSFDSYQPIGVEVDLSSVIQRERQRVHYLTSSTNYADDALVQYSAEGDHFYEHYNKEGGSALLF